MSEPLTIPAHVQPYVDVLGVDLAVTLLMEFGGAPLYLPSSKVRADSRLVQTVGKEKALALGKRIGGGLVKVPLAKPFLAAYYLSQGMPVVEIARTLHIDLRTVQRWLPERPGAQLSLFDAD